MISLGETHKYLELDQKILDSRAPFFGFQFSFSYSCFVGVETRDHMIQCKAPLQVE